jgi:hypothetical protein
VIDPETVAELGGADFIVAWGGFRMARSKNTNMREKKQKGEKKVDYPILQRHEVEQQRSFFHNPWMIDKRFEHPLFGKSGSVPFAS